MFRSLLAEHSKETQEGELTRRSLNDSSLAHAYSLLGVAPRTCHELWLDGGVIAPETPMCKSGGVGHLYFGNDIIATHRVPANRLACSYWAEGVTHRACLRAFLPQLLNGPPGALLVATDSMSFLQALAKGPLLTNTELEDDVLDAYRQLIAAGWKVVILFVYSHVGTERNEKVDEAVDRYLAHIPDHELDTGSIWLTDVVRATRRYLTQLWHASAPCSGTYRARHFGVNPSPLKQFEAEGISRKEHIEFARMRTGESTLFGTYRLRMGIARSAACRLCERSEYFHPDPPTEPPPPDNFPCPHCNVQCRSSVGLQRHVARVHPVPSRRTSLPKISSVTCENNLTL